MNLDGTPSPALRPDAQAFDEVRIITAPRYKQSGLSGDEWRISAHAQFLRKGVVVYEYDARDVETALHLAAGHWCRAIDDGKAYFASEKDRCDQEGCANQATVKYLLKQHFCNAPDLHREVLDPLWQKNTRQFCALHQRRGDCGFEDADANYEPCP